MCYADRRAQNVPGASEWASVNAEGETSSAFTEARLSWAQLLTRVFTIDMKACFQCVSPVVPIANIEDPYEVLWGHRLPMAPGGQ